MADLAALTARNAERWQVAKLTRGPEFAPVARRLIANRYRYDGIAGRTGVPWFVIAVIHEREADGDFMANIAQGDPWNRVSVHIPRGRGPFNSFDDAAVDALCACPPYASHWRDWSPGGTLTLLEQYNGLGYANKGLPSPYIWAGTDQYHSGKYVADGVFDPNAVDRQLGCAGLLMAMNAFTKTLPVPQAPVPIPMPPDVPLPQPEPLPQLSFWQEVLEAIVSILTQLFRRK